MVFGPENGLEADPVAGGEMGQNAQPLASGNRIEQPALSDQLRQVARHWFIFRQVISGRRGLGRSVFVGTALSRGLQLLLLPLELLAVPDEKLLDFAAAAPPWFVVDVDAPLLFVAATPAPVPPAWP
ncbi:MAG TPA: hypothetical protein VKT80_01960, partial [Chloroflexota bacterium]|nr:hypothetical protein [Chloroflexota bacterium]